MKVAQPPLIEIATVGDIFATGVCVEDSTEYVRLIYWSDHPPEGRMVVARVVLPVKKYHQMIARLVGNPTVLS